MKEYDLFMLDEEVDKPSFTTDKGKFWLVRTKGSYSIYKFTGYDGHKAFVAIQKGKVAFDSPSYEDACVKAEVFGAFNI